MFRVVVLLMWVVSDAGSASAQTSGIVGSQQGTAEAAPVRVVAGGDGFAIESGTGDYRLQIGLLTQADGRLAVRDTARSVADTFVMRRLRPYLRGRLLRRFEFSVVPDFGNGNVVVQDAYLDTVFSHGLRIRAGKAKTPFGLERLHSGSNLLFMERALPTAVAPNRDVGLQVLGELYGGVISYVAGVMNGVADGGSVDLDMNDGKDASARIVVRPFTRRTTNSLRGFGVAISGSAGRQEGAAALPAFRTAILQQPFFSYASGAVADGTRRRYSPQVFFYRGPFGGWGEYVHSEVPVTRECVTEDIAHEAWQIAASWVVTGEAATDAGTGIRPRAAFEPSSGHWGAFQIAGRVHGLNVDRAAVDVGFAAAGASRRAQAWTVGLNWFLNGSVKYVMNFERTVFDDTREGPRPSESGIAFRTQLFF